jgi:hypothetical protein
MKNILLLILAVFLFISCDDTTPPSRPVFDAVKMVQSSAPWSFEEKGITSRSEGDYIQVEWYKPASSLYFKNYRLERTDVIDVNTNKPINFELIKEMPGYYDTLYVDTTQIVLNRFYYYRVAVLNVDEKLSEFSDTSYYRVGPKPVILSVFSEETDTTKDMVFSIDINNPTFPQPVYLRIYHRPEESRVVISELDPSAFWESGNGIADFRMSDLVDIESGKSVSVRTDIVEDEKIRLNAGAYQVRVDYVGQELYHSGAKSGWVQFNY